MDSAIYKKYIAEMLERIDDERYLKQIYTIVHRKFIRVRLEEENERKG